LSSAGWDWTNPPVKITLAQGDVHLWRVCLNQPGPVVARLAGYLSEDEIERSASYRFSHLRRRFQVGRGVLREIISRYLRIAPNSLRFTYGEYGKSDLVPDQNPGDIRFNLAHSGETALYAITFNRSIGVDLEASRPIPDQDQLARRNFSPMEFSDYIGLEPTEKSPAFYRCWTRKEAFIKAVGKGLSFPLDQFDVSLLPDQPARLIAVRGDEWSASQWSMAEPVLGPGYVAALVIEGSLARIHCYDWRGFSDD
jgi:4'-phosphopantetheinyl transferase